MVNLVPATAEHVEALYGKSLPVTIFGIAGVEGDQVRGMGATTPPPAGAGLKESYKTLYRAQGMPEEQAERLATLAAAGR